MELNRKHFRAMIFYDFRRGLSQQECLIQLIFTFVEHYVDAMLVTKLSLHLNSNLYSFLQQVLLPMFKVVTVHKVYSLLCNGVLPYQKCPCQQHIDFECH